MRFPAAAQDDSADSIQAFLNATLDHKRFGMVIGLVDEHGSRIFSAGRLDNDTDDEVNGDTVFGIGSVTKTFTALLLQDQVERGEMRLEDPVAKYLPSSVKVPSFHGREITLLDLVTHTSGLPAKPANATAKDGDPYVDYTADKLYSFLSGYTLTNEPGTRYEYSDLGIGLLAHAITLKTGTNYETLVVNRICRVLHMDSTRITLTPDLKKRLAAGHSSNYKPARDYNFHVMAGAGALRSTANDLLKYVSANLGLVPSDLTPLMQKTHVIRFNDPAHSQKVAMAWMTRGEGYQSGLDLLGHPGGTVGYGSFVGFDQKRRRGVVVLSNHLEASGVLPPETIGWLLLRDVRLTPQVASVLLTGNSHELVGIGARLDLDAATHMVRIGEVFSNSPAAHAGLSNGLIIQKIDNVPTSDKSMTECVGLIRGPAGTSVRLELINTERNKTNTVMVSRQKYLSNH